jgi:hypothetical protein
VPAAERWYNPVVKEEEMEGTTQVLEEKKATSGGAACLIRKVKGDTKRRFTFEEKIKIVLEGFHKELPVTDLLKVRLYRVLDHSNIKFHGRQ